MKPGTSKLSSEDVLNAFAVEPSHDRSTLERYLREHPQYAVELAHLSHELSRAKVAATDLSEKDRLAIDEAWKQYSSSPTTSTANVFATLSVPQRRDLANLLGVPRQIITAFREHKVIVSSIPKRFLTRVAAALNTSVEQIRVALAAPMEVTCVRSYKSDEKPVEARVTSFERLLIEAQVPADKRAELMAEEN
jgi:hypothetical protein